MTQELKSFILNNKNLINQNTKESWEKIYDRIPKNIRGEFTKILLDVSIDPAEILGYIPTYYLSKSEITNYEIPDNITSIGDFSFYNCDSLTNV